MKIETLTRPWLWVLLSLLALSAGGCYLISALPSSDRDALQLAAEAGRIDEVVELVRAGDDPNRILTGSGRYTTFQELAKSSDFEGLKIVFDLGGDPRVLTAIGDSIITEVASSSGDTEIAEWLIERGADPCVPLSDEMRSANGVETPAELAEKRGFHELAVVLAAVLQECSERR